VYLIYKTAILIGNGNFSLSITGLTLDENKIASD
jgi:hypothetical protein